MVLLFISASVRVVNQTPPCVRATLQIVPHTWVVLFFDRTRRKACNLVFGKLFPNVNSGYTDDIFFCSSNIHHNNLATKILGKEFFSITFFQGCCQLIFWFWWSGNFLSNFSFKYYFLIPSILSAWGP